MNSQILPLHRDLDIVGPMSREPALPIGALLVDAGRLTHDEAERIHDYQKKVGLPFGEAGISMGLLTDEDVRHALALQFGHATISPDAGLGKDLVAAYEPDSPAVEHLRSLRAQLMLRWFENDTGHQSALAVVSPGSGEGRSYITANLAVLFSQMGKRTLVIDADLRKPRQHQIFGLPQGHGLSTLLAGRSEHTATFPVPGLNRLSVLPAGPLPPNPQELLSRPIFASFLADLKNIYDVVIIDTPPSRHYADAQSVAFRAGDALVVTRKDHTPMATTSRTIKELAGTGARVVGTVVNEY